MATIMVPITLANGTRTYVEATVEAADHVGAASSALAGPISGGGVPASLSGLKATIEGYAQEFTSIWEVVKPKEATIELGFTAKYEAGVLLGALVRGNAEANIKVTLKWTP